MSLQLTEAQEAQLMSMAEREGRQANELLQEAVDELLAKREEHRRAIERARQAVKDGRLLDGEEVWARLEKRFGW